MRSLHDGRSLTSEQLGTLRECEPFLGYRHDAGEWEKQTLRSLTACRALGILVTPEINFKENVEQKR